MKRMVSIFFVLLANIAFLAHDIIPHHHQITATIIDRLGGHAVCEHHHSSCLGFLCKHGTEESETCPINETSVLPHRGQEDTVDTENCDNFDYNLFYLSESIPSAPYREICSVKPKSHTAEKLLDRLARSFGLRAPPVC